MSWFKTTEAASTQERGLQCGDRRRLRGPLPSRKAGVEQSPVGVLNSQTTTLCSLCAGSLAGGGGGGGSAAEPGQPSYSWVTPGKTELLWATTELTEQGRQHGRLRRQCAGAWGEAGAFLGAPGPAQLQEVEAHRALTSPLCPHLPAEAAALPCSVGTTGAPS